MSNTSTKPSLYHSNNPTTSHRNTSLFVPTKFLLPSLPRDWFSIYFCLSGSSNLCTLVPLEGNKQLVKGLNDFETDLNENVNTQCSYSELKKVLCDKNNKAIKSYIPSDTYNACKLLICFYVILKAKFTSKMNTLSVENQSSISSQDVNVSSSESSSLTSDKSSVRTPRLLSRSMRSKELVEGTATKQKNPVVRTSLGGLIITDSVTTRSNSSSRSNTPERSGSVTKTKRESVSTKKKKVSRMETKDEVFNQDSPSNDNYCWECHRDGEFICCEMCPRVYHLRCTSLDCAPPEDWACHHCHSIMLADNVENRSRAMQLISVEQLGTMLKFALERVKKMPMMDPFIQPVDTTKFPTYPELVVHPVNLVTLEQNIDSLMYGSTEAFSADVAWILHNSVIFNGAHSKVTQLAKTALKMIKQEMGEIETCPDCYMNAHQKPTSWFTEACRLAHPLVWARLKGFPYWPAKAVKWHNSSVDVRFFGRHDRAWVQAKDCYLLSEKMPVPLKNKNKTLEACMIEVRDHIDNLKERFSEFVYAPHKLHFNPSDPLQVQLLLPTYKGPPLALIHTQNIDSKEQGMYFDDESSFIFSGENNSKDAEIASKNTSKQSSNSLLDEDKTVDVNSFSGFEEKGELTNESIETEQMLLEEDCDDEREEAAIMESSEEININHLEESLLAFDREREMNSEPVATLLKDATTDGVSVGGGGNNGAENGGGGEQEQVNGGFSSASGQSGGSSGGSGGDDGNNGEESGGNNWQDAMDDNAEEEEEEQELEDQEEEEVVNDESLQNLDSQQDGEFNLMEQKVDEGSTEHQPFDEEQLLLAENEEQPLEEQDEEQLLQQQNEEQELLQQQNEEQELLLRHNEEQELLQQQNEEQDLLQQQDEDKLVMQDNQEQLLQQEDDEQMLEQEEEEQENEEQLLQQQDEEQLLQQQDEEQLLQQEDEEQLLKLEEEEEMAVDPPATDLNAEEQEALEFEAALNESTAVTIQKIDSAKDESVAKDPLTSFGSSISISRSVSAVVSNPSISVTSSDTGYKFMGCSVSISQSNGQQNKRKADDSEMEKDDGLASKRRRSDDDDSGKRSGELDRKLGSAVSVTLKGSSSLSIESANEDKEPEYSGETERIMSMLGATVDIKKLPSDKSADEMKEKASEENESMMDSLGKISKEISVQSVRAESKSRDNKSYDPLTSLSSSISINKAVKPLAPTLPPGVTVSNVSVIKNSSGNADQSIKGDEFENISTRKLVENTQKASKEMSSLMHLSKEVDVKPILDEKGDVVSSDSHLKATSNCDNVRLPSCVDTSKLTVSVSITPVHSHSERTKSTAAPSRPNSSTSATSRPSSGTSVRSSSASPANTSLSISSHGHISVKNSSVLQENSVPPPPPLSQPKQNNYNSMQKMPQLPNQAPRLVGVQNPAGKLQHLLRNPMMGGPVNPMLPPEAGTLSSQLHQASHKLADIMRAQLEEVLTGLVVQGTPEARVAALQLELERSNWRHQQEISEVRHNADVMVNEMRQSLDAEKMRALEEARRSVEQQISEQRRQMERRFNEKVADLRRQFEADKQRAVEETKKKQWCANCGKEALFFCCWNTSYCDYPCQQAHWPQHMSVCGQNSEGGGGGGGGANSVNSNSATNGGQEMGGAMDVNGDGNHSRVSTPLQNMNAQNHSPGASMFNSPGSDPSPNLLSPSGGLSQVQHPHSMGGGFGGMGGHHNPMRSAMNAGINNSIGVMGGPGAMAAMAAMAGTGGGSQGGPGGGMKMPQRFMPPGILQQQMYNTLDQRNLLMMMGGGGGGRGVSQPPMGHHGAGPMMRPPMHYRPRFM